MSEAEYILNDVQEQARVGTRITRSSHYKQFLKRTRRYQKEETGLGPRVRARNTRVRLAQDQEKVHV